MIRCLACCGIHPGDVLQNACAGELFADGLGLHAAAEALGATVIPVAGGDSDRQLMALKDFGVSAVCSTPSYFLHLAERAEKAGINLRQLPLRAESLSPSGARPRAGRLKMRRESKPTISTACPR